MSERTAGRLKTADDCTATLASAVQPLFATSQLPTSAVPLRVVAEHALDSTCPHLLPHTHTLQSV